MKNKELFQEIEYKNLKKYSVFIPIIEINGENYIIFEKRSDEISQPGEVSFPGGALENGETFEEASIRELKEELLLEDDQFELLGESATKLEENTNRIVKSFYGKIKIDKDDLRYNEEVSYLIFHKISELKSNPPKVYKCKIEMIPPDDFPFNKIKNGRDYKFLKASKNMYFYDTDPTIWGLTADLLRVFVEGYTNGK
ncbi:MAG: NUDIX domain-containing protein [Peptoniphilaceae bacterium]|nr:NUDIX domain-containing protein [Peptoniphilaceae bacterium]MDD7383556.1 NUDIX domain-containing protein [Peptoniphilaceae bacterium]MDY3738729.1 NUDIX domain-containing protein [Peptoniphilaceae bacterium]